MKALDPAKAVPFEGGTLWSIQYLRGYAAVAVVAFHVAAFRLAPVGWGKLAGGARGVEIFFVISGFIMFWVARAEPFGTFWRRRIIRIVPLYWLCTAWMAACLALQGLRPSGSALLASLLFIPRFSDWPPDKIWPVLYVGWTLQYEMFFYVLFSLGLLVRRPVLLPALAIGVLVTSGRFHTFSAAPMIAYTDPIMLEFAAGLVIAASVRTVRFAGVRHIIWPALAALWWEALPPAATMLAACAVVLGAVGFEQHRRVAKLGAAALLGAASYAIYLSHAVVIWILGKDAIALPPGVLVALLSLLGAVVAGVGMHLYVERPLGSMLRRLLRQDKVLTSKDTVSARSG